MAELQKGNKWHERKDAKDRKGNPIVKYPLIAEVKHDEIRCHVKRGCDPAGPEWEFLSYAGKPLANMQEFAHFFEDLSSITLDTEFDCGFEVNGNYNDSYRWVRSTKGLPPDLKAKAEVQFYLYDLPMEGEYTQKFRDGIRKDVCYIAGDWLKMPKQYWCTNESEVDATFSLVTSLGFEGLMLKDPNSVYERKRTDAWLKMKPEDTIDGRIVGLIEATATVDDPVRGVRVGDCLGRVGSIEVVCEDGSKAVPCGIAHGLGRDMLLNPTKYIGQWLEFAYMERDRQGGYRHPRFKRLREDKQ